MLQIYISTFNYYLIEFGNLGKLNNFLHLFHYLIHIPFPNGISGSAKAEVPEVNILHNLF